MYFGSPPIFEQTAENKSLKITSQAAMSLPRAHLVGDVVPQQAARGSSSPLRGRSIPRELPPSGRKQSTTRGNAGKAPRENETGQSSVERRRHIDIVGDKRREW